MSENFQRVSGENFQIITDFKRKNEENSYQTQNLLKKSGNS